MQNYYIRIEDMPSLVSHQLSIIKYVVLKKIFYFFSVLTVSFGLGLEPLWTWTCLGLKKKVDLTTALGSSLTSKYQKCLYSSYTFYEVCAI